MAFVNIFYKVHTTAAQAQIRAFAKTYKGSMAEMMAATAQMQLVMQSWKAAFMPLAYGAVAAGAITGAAFVGAYKAVAPYETSLVRIAIALGEYDKATGKVSGSVQNFGKIVMRTTEEYGYSTDVAMEGSILLAQSVRNLGEAQEYVVPLIKAATASGIEFDEVVRIGMSVIKAWNLPANEMERTLDALLSVTFSAKIEFSDWNEVLSNAATSAAATGVSLAELAAMAGTCTENALEASVAGTGLSRMMLYLGTNTEETEKRWADLTSCLGISLARTEDMGDNILNIMNAMRESTTSVDVLTASMKAVGIRGARALATLLLHGDTYKELLGVIDSSQGMVDTSANAWARSLEGIKIHMMDVIMNSLRTEDVQNKLVYGFEMLSSSLEAMMPQIATLAVMLIDRFVELMPKLLTLFSTLTNNISGFLPVLDFFIGLMGAVVSVLNYFGPILPFLITCFIIWKIQMGFINALLTTHAALVSFNTLVNLKYIWTQFLATKHNAFVYATNLSLAKSYALVASTQLMTIIMTGLMFGGFILLAYGMQKGNDAAKVLGVALTVLGGVILALKVYNWALEASIWGVTLANYAGWIATGVGIAVVLIAIAATVIAFDHLNKVQEEQRRNLEKLNKQTAVYDNNITSATTSNYAFASSLGAINSSAMQQYEVFLLLTEATEGYIYTMGRVITPTVPAAATVPVTYQYGGIVPGPVGVPVPIIAHGGERFLGVRGTTPGGAGGTTITINFEEVHIHEEADLTGFAKRIGREVERRMM